MAATHPAAVISFFISAADTLDHHQVFGLHNRFIALGDLFSQLKMGEHLVVLTIEIFSGLILLGANCQDRGTVFDLFNSAFSFNFCGKIPQITGNILDGRCMRYVDQRVFIDLADDLSQMCLNIKAFYGGIQSTRHAAQFFILFHQMNLMPLFGDG